jgi:glutathione S-transferase
MGLAYTEERWAVGLHAMRARRIAKGTTLPILVAGSDLIQGSGLILDWTGMQGSAPALEQRFEERVGVLVRQLIYTGTLGVVGSGDRDALLDGVSPGQALLGRLMWPITRRLMVSGMNARPALVPELEHKIIAELDWFEDELAGRQHLIGDKFGRADLTAASLLAPLARPSACPLYRNVRTPERLEQVLTRWRARRSLQWVEEIYAKYRHSTIGQADQHKLPHAFPTLV